MLPLSELKPGQIGKVIKLDTTCQGFERYRLLDLGIVPGTKISHALENPLKDPIAYNIRGAVIALRKEQANKIFVKLEES